MASVDTDNKTLDPKKHADWEVAQDAEKRMKTIYCYCRRDGTF